MPEAPPWLGQSSMSQPAAGCQMPSLRHEAEDVARIPFPRNQKAQGSCGLTEASLSSGHSNRAEPTGPVLWGQVASGDMDFFSKEVGMPC